MDWLNWVSDPQAWIALATLTALEIVLGVDNIIFISILSGKLPAHDRDRARRVGLSLAMIMRILLLLGIAWLARLTSPLFAPFGHELSGRDLILLGGGLFLLWKATNEMHDKLEGEEKSETARTAASFASVIVQILALDLVFSLDSVITAIGMANDIPVMIAAVVIAVAFMMFFAKPLGDFVERHPTVKMLALAFLLLVGVTLVAEGFGQHISKGYVYFAMAFSVFVEAMNLRVRSKTPPVHLHSAWVAEPPAGAVVLPASYRPREESAAVREEPRGETGRTRREGGRTEGGRGERPERGDRGERSERGRKTGEGREKGRGRTREAGAEKPREPKVAGEVARDPLRQAARDAKRDERREARREEKRQRVRDERRAVAEAAAGTDAGVAPGDAVAIGAPAAGEGTPAVQAPRPPRPPRAPRPEVAEAAVSDQGVMGAPDESPYLDEGDDSEVAGGPEGGPAGETADPARARKRRRRRGRRGGRGAAENGGASGAPGAPGAPGEPAGDGSGAIVPPGPPAGE